VIHERTSENESRPAKAPTGAVVEEEVQVPLPVPVESPKSETPANPGEVAASEESSSDDGKAEPPRTASTPQAKSESPTASISKRAVTIEAGERFEVPSEAPNLSKLPVVVSRRVPYTWTTVGDPKGSFSVRLPVISEVIPREESSVDGYPAAVSYSWGTQVAAISYTDFPSASEAIRRMEVRRGEFQNGERSFRPLRINGEPGHLLCRQVITGVMQ
jgi:hypothetical protein